MGTLSFRLTGRRAWHTHVRREASSQLNPSRSFGLASGIIGRSSLARPRWSAENAASDVATTASGCRRDTARTIADMATAMRS